MARTSVKRRAALFQSLRRLLKFSQRKNIDDVVTELEYWQWVSDPEKPTWCAMAIRNVHGNDRQIISALHRAATREPVYEAEFRMVSLMEETGERSLLPGDQIRIIEGDETRRFQWNGRSWMNA